MNNKQRKVDRQWIEALRSGNYRQGDNSLRRNDAYCCHGVLLDVVDSDGWHPPAREGGRASHVHGRIRNDADNAWADLMPDLAWFERTTGLSEEVAFSLAEMNDRGVPFEDIAGTVESLIEGR